MINNLYKKYKEEVIPAMKKEFGFKNVMQAPKVTRVIINVGVGKMVKEPNFIENVAKTLSRITGQKPLRTKAKKSISNFKVREGTEIGVMVTLRGKRMYDFLEKMINVTFPRVRDFHGISGKSFDTRGNYTIGFKENLAFPEIKMEEIDKIHGLEITINTSARNAGEGRALLTYLGFPFLK